MHNTIRITIRSLALFLSLSASMVACGGEHVTAGAGYDDAPSVLTVVAEVIDCNKRPLPPGCGDDGGGGDEPPPPPPVYVSYSITNSGTLRRFCDVTMVTSTNPNASGSYYYWYLDPAQSYGGYHVSGGAPPYPVEFRVGCWPDENTPVEQRIYTVRAFTLNASTRFNFTNTDAGGVVLSGSEQTP